MCEIQNDKSEMPSYEVILKRKYMQFYDVWNIGKQLVYSNARQYGKQQKPVKLRIGCEFTSSKLGILRGKYIVVLTDDNDGILDEVVDKAFNPILSPEHRC